MSVDPKTSPSRQLRWGIGSRVLLLVAGFILAGGAAAMAYFTIGVIDASGNNAIAQATGLSAPAIPTATETAATRVKVAWTLPGSQLPGASYQVTASPGGATCTSSGNSCSVTGLAIGTPYTFSVMGILDNWQSLSVATSFTTLGVTTTSLANGVAGASYSATLRATGGIGTYTWALVSGILPAGLSLDASSGAITGTPTVADTTSGLTFTVTDSSGFTSTSGSQSITVTRATPTIATTLSASSTTVGGTAYDTSSFTGLVNSDGTGTVTYSYFTDNACSVSPVAGGVKTVPTNGSVPNSTTVTFANAGSYYWQAVYSGDSNNNSASSPCTLGNNELLTVNAATPTNVVADNATPALGESVTFTATITGPAGATAPAGGTVVWTVSGTSGATSCTTSSDTTLNASSQATCVLTTANAGTYVVSDSWSGTSNYNSKASANDTVTVTNV